MTPVRPRQILFLHHHVVVAQQGSLGALQLGDGDIVVGDRQRLLALRIGQPLLGIQLKLNVGRIERLAIRLALLEGKQRIAGGETRLPPAPISSQLACTSRREVVTSCDICETRKLYCSIACIRCNCARR